MQGFGMALIVTLILVLLFLLVGLPLIKEIEEARIQRLLIAERMSQHRQQVTLMIGGMVAMTLLILAAGYFWVIYNESRRDHERYLAELHFRHFELEYYRQRRQPQYLAPPGPSTPTIIVIEAGGERRPNRGTALELASRQTGLTESPRVIYQNERGEWQ